LETVIAPTDPSGSATRMTMFFGPQAVIYEIAAKQHQQPIHLHMAGSTFLNKRLMPSIVPTSPWGGQSTLISTWVPRTPIVAAGMTS
jgi:hypothetical protein